MKKPVFKKRDLIELSLVVIIFAVIFLTNSQAEVFGRVQGVVLKTGIFNASGLEEDEYLRADYDFKVRDENGQLLDGESLRGKTIFMNLWATWCPPCVAEMPSIDALYQDFKEQNDIVFLIISEDKDFNKAKKWIADKDIDLPIYQLATPLPDVYETGLLPSTFVISPKEKVVVRTVGMANYDTKRFRRLLNRLDKQDARSN